MKKSIIFLLLMFPVVQMYASVDLGGLNPKDPAKGVIDDAEKAAQRLLSQAQGTGNGLVSHAGSELDAAVQSALLVLGDDINKSLGQLDESEQKALVALQGLNKSLSGDIATVYDIKDTMAVDLTQWESGWLIAKTPDFYVQTIKGTALLPQPGNYHLTLIGYGFGINSESKADVSATLDGKAVTLTDVDQTRNGVAVLGIPAADLNPLFQNGALKIVTLGLKVHLARHHWYGWKTHDYSFPVRITLYPKQIAQATLHVTTPVYNWVDTGVDVLSAPSTTPDKDGCDGNVSCRANNGPLDVRVPGPLSGSPIVGGQRISSASLQCNSGSICDFAGCGNISIVENGTHATATWCTWSHPTQWQLRGHVQEWRQTGSKTADQQIDLALDAPKTINIPADASLLTVDVKAFSGQVYTLVLPANDPHDLVNIARQGLPSSPVLVVTAVPPAPQY